MSDSSKAVFLSYAREDAEAAKRIAEALRAFGVEVWFDQNELRGGDSWDQKIRNQIKECALFVPIVSATTQARGEGYFRREWKLAVDRTNDMAAGRTFLLPLVIDDTREDEALVPDEFMRVQWTRLPAGRPSPEFVGHVRAILEAPLRPAARSRSAAPAATAHPAKPATAGRSPAIWIGAIVVVAAIAFFVFRSRSGPESAAPLPVPPKPAAEPVAAKPAAGPAVAAPVNAKSIAVLPFENMSEDKDSGFFADGMHEDILTNLALVRELHVVSRTSVMQYRGTTKSVREIAKELGVAYVLEGSVRRAGSKVRVTGQLIDARTDEHIWAKAYDRDATDVFAIQAELSQAIATALSAALSPQEKQLLDRRPTENLAAYDAYLKARGLRQRNTGTAQEGEPFLREAVRLDPKFALAWAELASSIAQSYLNDFDHSDARLAQAKAAIDTAVRLAPDDPDVIERLGDYYYYAYRDYERATEQYLRLAALRPNDAAVIGSLGFIHRRQGRWAEAVAELRRAAELEPRDLRFGHTLVLLLLGLNRYEEANAAQAQVIASAPDSLVDTAQTVLIPYAWHGSMREGDALLGALTSTQPNDPLVLYWRKAWARAAGNWAEAVKLDQQHRYNDVFGEPHWSQDVTSAFSLWASGDQAAARALAASAIPGGKEEIAQKASATSWVTLASAYAIVGDKAEALRCAQAAKEMIPEAKDAVAGPPISSSCAQILAWTGDKDRALAEFARLLRTPFGENIYAAKANPGWLPLWNDPRFQALVNDPKNNAPLP